MKSPTPRTDENECEVEDAINAFGFCEADFARQLETENIMLKQCNEQFHEMVYSLTVELRKYKSRYEFVRKLNAREFTEIYSKNVRTGIPFDYIIDEAIAKEIK